MKRSAAVGLVVLVTASNIFAYQTGFTGRWKSYTDKRLVRSASNVSGNLWAASAGGVFRFIPSQNQFTTFTNSEGLSTNDVTALTEGAQGRLWFGTGEGYVNMFEPASNVWKQIDGIAESERVQKAVRSLTVHNDTLFVGTDFGVVVYLTSSEEFGDSYTNFGYAAQPRVNDVLVHDYTIWVATDSGVVSAPLALPNLSSPLAWTRHAVGLTSGSRTVRSLALFNGQVYAGTGDGVFYFNGSFTAHPGLGSRSVVELRTSSDAALLFVLSNNFPGFSVETVASNVASANIIAMENTASATALASEPAESNLWVGTSSRGLARWNGAEWSYHAPNGPESNFFSSLAVDELGVLWGASGISGRGAGFYRFDISLPEDSRWKNFTYQQYPILGNDPADPERNDYYKISVGLNGSVWTSNWGRGVAEAKNDSVVRRITIPIFSTAVSSDPDYVVMGGVATDDNGGTWFINRSADDRNYLVRMTDDTVFTDYPRSTNTTEGRFTALAIDRNGTKWIANSEPTNKPTTGLVYFNETPGIVSGTIGGWGQMQEPLIPHDAVLSLAVDLEGDVCVGTDAGMLIITNPQFPTQNTFRPLPVIGQSIQAIAVDAINNKWVGTREGIHVLSPDGVQLLNSYTVASTQGKLLSDDIRSLAIDQQRGILYIGTEKGLSSLEIPAVQASRSYTTLEFGPNPYRLPSAEQLVIRNLAANSSVRIMTVSGRVVREFPAQGGGRAFWDGRNSDGELVPTGIYFVVAYTENGTQLTTGKIAVVRR
ncbi:MAG: hypothetical protein L0Y80_01045 [Ignavibacteriae bacterium]|nr:hypothetical protein [Ignavibacteriota bacterium]